jgi:hypothetical protein
MQILHLSAMIAFTASYWIKKLFEAIYFGPLFQLVQELLEISIYD